MTDTETHETPQRSHTLPALQCKTLQPKKSKGEEMAELLQRMDLLSPLELHICV